MNEVVQYQRKKGRSRCSAHLDVQSVAVSEIYDIFMHVRGAEDVSYELISFSIRSLLVSREFRSERVCSVSELSELNNMNASA